jgi:hypothetical protein
VVKNKNVKNIIFINVWRKIVFDIHFTEFGTVMTTVLPVLFKYCYKYCCENRNDPDLVQAFLKKWWVESDFKAPNLPLSLRLKVSGCHYNSIYNNTWTKQGLYQVRVITVFTVFRLLTDFVCLYTYEFWLSLC